MIINVGRRQRRIINSFKDKQVRRLYTLTELDFVKLTDLLKPIILSFKRKNQIKWITVKYQLIPGIYYEVFFRFYLKNMYACISKMLYDYDYKVCLDNEPFPDTDRPQIRVINMTAHSVEGSRNSDFTTECNRLGRIRY